MLDAVGEERRRADGVQEALVKVRGWGHAVLEGKERQKGKLVLSRGGWQVSISPSSLFLSI